MRSTPPKSRKVVRWASIGDSPRRSRSADSIARWKSISRRTSSLKRRPLRSRCTRRAHFMTMAILAERPSRLCFGSQHARDRASHSFPVLGFHRELPFAALGQAVELRLAVVLGRAPLGRNPALLFEPVERRIERTLVDAEHVLRDLLQPLRDAPAVLGTEPE